MAPGYAVPAWMEEETRHLAPEQQEAERQRLFAVSTVHLPSMLFIALVHTGMLCEWKSNA